MIKYECIFRKSRAGYLETKEPIDNEEKKYGFMPYRSKAHLKLAQLVKQNKRPVTILRSEQDATEAIVTGMSPDSITLKKVEVTGKKSILKKLFGLS